ncbi:hypothetical protein DT076_00075 [Desertihabitans brevis]|uniref:Uncharacterized protein n=1 Tax=Desertihabitans brevis TaxID=2268447 RepID=A0A367YYN0_9ACTN|nr:hypothetical protein [Desertihabitans brevis]RCK70928.1 hypothetical protein DT076_00075 [Desertihabitans brevis]
MSREAGVGRLVTTDEAVAAELAATLTAAGYAADAGQEPTADGRGWHQVVQTDAPVDLLRELAAEEGVALEVADPMSGVSAPVPTQDRNADGV